MFSDLKVLRSFFRLKGVPSFVINKGRGEKRAVISGKRKIQLKHSVERYRDTFARGRISFDPDRWSMDNSFTRQPSAKVASIIWLPV